MTYAGDVYARFDNASSPLWNIINGNKAPVVDNVLISAAAPPTAAASISQWVELPFAQTMLDEDSHYTLVHGKVISNGIVNLDITPPAAQSDWVLNVSYIYGATLLMSQGTCDYVF
jgi:bisphosphoglycerate-independent phosphoglycerate mutase (AlkP superfamily)